MSDNQQRRDFLVKGVTALIVAGSCIPLCLQNALAEEALMKASGGEKKKDLEELAYCGLDCGMVECSIFRATVANDLKAKKKIADGWNKKYGTSIKPEEVACDGCRSKTGRLGYHCSTICDVRKCGLSRGIKSCAVCPDFPSCDKKLWGHFTAMRKRTEETRSRMGIK